MEKSNPYVVGFEGVDVMVTSKVLHNHIKYPTQSNSKFTLFINMLISKAKENTHSLRLFFFFKYKE